MHRHAYHTTDPKLPHFSSVIQKSLRNSVIQLLSITKKDCIFLPERDFFYSTKLWSVFQIPLHLNPVKIPFVTSNTLMFCGKSMFSFIWDINPQTQFVSLQLSDFLLHHFPSFSSEEARGIKAQLWSKLPRPHFPVLKWINISLTHSRKSRWQI